MEITVTSVCFPNVLTAVQAYNSTFFIKDGHGTVLPPVVLPFQNFKGIKGLAQVVQTQLNAATLMAWTVTPNELTNKLTFALPNTITTTYSLVFTSQVYNGSTVNAYASACKLLGFRQTDVFTITPTSPSIVSSVPCQASGASLVYIATDLFSLEGATVDLFGNTKRGSLLAKIQLTDAPWTVSTYQDQLTTFSLKLPAYNVSQLTVYLLNEELQPTGMPIDWSMSAIVRYYSAAPYVEMQQSLNRMEELLKFVYLTLRHNAEDEREREKAKRIAQRNAEALQGRAIE